MLSSKAGLKTCWMMPGSGIEQNASVCCELMEQTASIQHELFKLLHQLVTTGGLRINNPATYSTPNVSSQYQNIQTSRPNSAQMRRSRSPTPIRCQYGMSNAQVPHVTFGNGTSHVDQYNSTLLQHQQQYQQKQQQSGTFADRDLLEMLIKSQKQCDQLARKLKQQLSLHSNPQAAARSQVYSDRLYQSTNDINCNYYPTTSQTNHFNSGINTISPSSSGHMFNANVPQIPMINMTSSGQLDSHNPAARLRPWLSPLISQYNDLFTTIRVTTMDQLQSNGRADYERSQRLIFYTVQVCFAVTRQLLRRLYPSVCENLKSGRQTMGNGGTTRPYPDQYPETDIPLNVRQLSALQQATCRRLSRHGPPDCACRVLSVASTRGSNRLVRGEPFTDIELQCLTRLIEQVCSLAWYLLAEKRSPDDSVGLSTTPSPMRVWHVDVDRSARPGDMYDDNCYRRSFDSGSSAGMVHHYVWPCLLLFSRPTRSDLANQQLLMNTYATANQASYVTHQTPNTTDDLTACVLVKGEACTRDGAHPTTTGTASVLLNNEIYRSDHRKSRGGSLKRTNSMPQRRSTSAKSKPAFRFGK